MSSDNAPFSSIRRDHVPVAAVTVAIATRNRAELLSETVRSILAGSTVPGELVIVDQSAVQHPELSALRNLHGCDIRYVWTSTRGVARGRNMALAAARYDRLVLTDDDMLAAPEWLDLIGRALTAAGPRSVVTGMVRPADDGTSAGFVPSTKQDGQAIVYRGRVGADVLYTGNMAIYRSALLSLGGFDERLGPGTRYPAAEDNDLGFRLLEAGFEIVYAPEAVLYHRAWRSSDARVRLKWGYGRGQGAFYAKHWQMRDLYMLRRFGADIRWRVVSFVRLSWRSRRIRVDDLAYLGGVVWGALAWSIRSLHERSGTKPQD